MKNTAEMTLGSLFDGIAGFPLAARRQGIKTVWVSEIEPDCIDIAKRHFPEALQLGDITQIDGAKIPVVDIISFGSPCQDLSVAGKQTGLDGSRSGLFMEAVRITREMREKTNGQYPKYIIWENVAGAFSSNKGEDFRRVLEEITQSNISMPKSGKWATAGMVGNEGPGGDVQCTAWRLLDAQFWGVPQRRKRIYLVNDFGNGRAGQILFECESVLGYHSQGGAEKQGNSGNSENSLTGTDCRGMAEDADGQMKLDFGRTADRIYINAKTSVTLMGNAGGRRWENGLIFTSRLHHCRKCDWQEREKRRPPVGRKSRHSPNAYGCGPARRSVCRRVSSESRSKGRGNWIYRGSKPNAYVSTPPGGSVWIYTKRLWRV